MQCDKIACICCCLFDRSLYLGWAIDKYGCCPRFVLYGIVNLEHDSCLDNLQGNFIIQLYYFN